MATVYIHKRPEDRKVPYGHVAVRQAQIVSEGPPGTSGTKWAYTTDDGPRVPLLLRKTLRHEEGSWDAVEGDMGN